ncbi:MAG TPA: hypothetical protein VJV40_07795, partial [Thermodesulfobacteriota bacterium]|nr:hypothetical protein [Thermodesulfobacteriota bacterium]
IIMSAGTSGENADEITALYELYTGDKPGYGDREYFESIKHMDARVIEAALILTILKGKGGSVKLSQIGEVLADLEAELPDGYIEHLREVWKTIRSGEQ